MTTPRLRYRLLACGRVVPIASDVVMYRLVDGMLQDYRPFDGSWYETIVSDLVIYEALLRSGALNEERTTELVDQRVVPE